MKSRAEIVSETKISFGDDYFRHTWFDRKSARQAEEERHKLLASLPSDIESKFNKTKLHFGSLSPGCLICGEGRGASLFLDDRCHSSCFFCPYEKPERSGDFSPLAWGGVPYDDPHEFVEFLKGFDVQGVAFTGGEPFLRFERLMEYLKAIRKHMPRDIYTWIYTGGSLVDLDNLKQLKDLGLNELRFNLCATEYDLLYLKKALKEIERVSVEIPVIPEDVEVLKTTFIELEKLGVDYVNLHQLTTTRHNAARYAQRKYTLLHHASNPVFESEMAALSLLKYSREKELAFPIHYCSAVFKRRFQDIGMRRKAADFLKEDFEEVTPLGYLRSLTIKDELYILHNHVGGFKNKGFLPDLWELSTEKEELHLHSQLVKKMDPCDSRFIVRYFDAQLQGDKSQGKGICPSSSRASYVRRQIVFEETDLSWTGIQALAQVWETPKDLLRIIKEFCAGHQFQTAKEMHEMLKEKRACIQAARYENTETGLETII